MSSSYKYGVLLLLLMAFVRPLHAEIDTEYSGHMKHQFLSTHYPSDTVRRQFVGAHSYDYKGESRWVLRASQGAWDVQVDYQMIGLYGDDQGLTQESLASPSMTATFQDDQHRLWRLTDIVSDDNDHAFIHRLDRMSVGYSGDKTVVRAGRQVISWGNGLMHNPMDMFNPFDPAAVDREYKSGDDMIYAQYLFDSGDDVQLVEVARRDVNTGKVQRNVASTALKFHGMANLNDVVQGFEYDVLLSRHYRSDVFGLGVSADIGGAGWYSDIIVAKTPSDTALSILMGSRYSWTQWGKNVTAVVEVFHNGFGLSDGDYSVEKLAAAVELKARLNRGELFTLGKNYLAAGIHIEVTPLLVLSPHAFLNVDDQSSLFQLRAQYHRWQDIEILAAVSQPIGPAGTEYGGLTTDTHGVVSGSGLSLFTQIAWYF